MIIMNWELNDDEQDLAEEVYYETKGSIYVDDDGSLNTSGLGERVDSRQCYAFDIFIGEIENARMRVADRLANQ
jgi:hypothetical protein